MSFQRSGGPRFIRTPPPNVTQRPTHVVTSDEHPLTLSIIAILPNGEMQSSTIHPSLREDVVLVPVTDISCGTTKGARLGLCMCPGKHSSRSKTHFRRSLTKDVAQLSGAHGVQSLACLLSDAELRSLQVPIPALQAALSVKSMQLLRLPMLEMAAPENFESGAAFVQLLVEQLQDGRSIAMHCKGGVGRAGTIAACVLLALREVTNATDAIKLVRQRRCSNAIESRRQEDWVRMYAAYMAANDAAASAKNDEHAAVNSSERATATIGAFEGNASKQRESKSSESKDSENSVRASMDGPQDASASTSATLAAIATEVRDTDSADQAGGTCAAPPLPGGMAAAAATVVWHGPARTSAPGKQRN